MLAESVMGFAGTGCIAHSGARSSTPAPAPFPCPRFAGALLACTAPADHRLRFTWPVHELKCTRKVLKTERRNTGDSMLEASLIAGAARSQNPGNFQMQLPVSLQYSEVLASSAPQLTQPCCRGPASRFRPSLEPYCRLQSVTT